MPVDHEKVRKYAVTHTQAETAKAFGVSRQRISVILKKSGNVYKRMLVSILGEVCEECRKKKVMKDARKLLK